MAEGGIASPSDYLAAERTFLAWIRTGLALMGFGFVVAQFGLMFRREIAMTTHDLRLESTGASLWMGTGLLLLGVVVNVAASINYVRLVGRLNRGDKLGQPSASAIAVALTLACVGLGFAAYLVLIR